MTEEINEELLEDLYAWVDHIPLSRPKKDIRRDFADGVPVAEVVGHFFPNIVELNNFISTSNTQQKKINWTVLNRKVFRKLHFEVRDDVIDNIVHCKAWAVEHFLMLLRRKIDRQLYENKRATQDTLQPPSQLSHAPTHSLKYTDNRPEVDQWTDAVSPTSERAKQTTGQSVSSKSQSQQSLIKAVKPPGGQGQYKSQGHRADFVPRIEVEELEQEILGRDETIQILEAKIRRLEQLLHLKDIRLDDLQTRLDRMETEKRPTAQVPAHGGHPPHQGMTRRVGQQPRR